MHIRAGWQAGRRTGSTKNPLRRNKNYTHSTLATLSGKLIVLLYQWFNMSFRRFVTSILVSLNMCATHVTKFKIKSCHLWGFITAATRHSGGLSGGLKYWWCYGFFLCTEIQIMGYFYSTLEWSCGVINFKLWKVWNGSAQFGSRWSLQFFLYDLFFLLCSFLCFSAAYKF